jgi:hypothetical protein
LRREAVEWRAGPRGGFDGGDDDVIGEVQD